MNVMETDRLIVRYFSRDDAPFVLELLNQPDFLRFIGDRQVRSVDDARCYLESGPICSYRLHGFGLYAVVLKESGLPIGMCGLLQREQLPGPDLGFAFLEQHRSRGYALESARSVLDYATTRLRLRRVLAIVDPANEPSIRLLRKLGMRLSTSCAPALRDDGERLLEYYVYGGDRPRGRHDGNSEPGTSGT